MCVRTKSELETVNEAIKEVKDRIADNLSDASYYRDMARTYRARAKERRRDAQAERETLKALRAEAKALKPQPKPRKPRGIPVAEYFEPQPVQVQPAEFAKYSNGFNVYD